MRILQVIPTYLPAVRYGGPIAAVHSLSRALIARGHDIEVITTNVNGCGTSPVPLNTRVMVDGVPVRYFGSHVLRRLSWAPSMSRALASALASFDLVHLHSVFLWPTWAAARLARRARCPHVISPRGMLVKELIEQRNRLIKSVWIELIERKNLERASAIHVTSKLEADELSQFGWKLPTIASIPNGVDDVQEFAGKDASADVKALIVEQPYALFLGRISWKKGPDRLLRAFARTRTGNLIIAGPDDERLVPELVRLSRDLEIANRVRFLPRTVVGCDKEQLYAGAQVFVLPSHSENFGNTVLEAMRRGRPAIVTPEVGAADIVTQAGGGLVVAGDPEPLGGAVERLMSDAPLARAMGAAGQRHVREGYSWPGIATRMEALYETLRRRPQSLPQ